MNRLLSYEEKKTPLHRLSGVTKLVFFLLWCLTSALTYDTRVLLVMVGISLVLYVLSGTTWQQVRSVFAFMLSPYQGTAIYGRKTKLSPFLPGHALTKEELFYLFNVFIKYFTVVPSVFIFLVTTDPSEFAASLNMVGLPYTISYSVAIALRYIPDIQSDFTRIRNAQEARGIEMSKKASLPESIRRTSNIIFPLLFSSMEHIDVVSNAMELRGFGKKRKRTWYAYRKLGFMDILVLSATVIFCVAALCFTFYDGSRYWYPWH